MKQFVMKCKTRGTRNTQATFHCNSKAYFALCFLLCSGFSFFVGPWLHKQRRINEFKWAFFAKLIWLYVLHWFERFEIRALEYSRLEMQMWLLLLCVCVFFFISLLHSVLAIWMEMCSMRGDGDTYVIHVICPWRKIGNKQRMKKQ